MQVRERASYPTATQFNLLSELVSRRSELRTNCRYSGSLVDPGGRVGAPLNELLGLEPEFDFVVGGFN